MKIYSYTENAPYNVILVNDEGAVLNGDYFINKVKLIEDNKYSAIIERNTYTYDTNETNNITLYLLGEVEYTGDYNDTINTFMKDYHP